MEGEFIQMGIHDKHAIEIVAYLRGYDVAEVENALDEGDDAFDVDLASDVAEITSRLKNYVHELTRGMPGVRAKLLAGDE